MSADGSEVQKDQTRAGFLFTPERDLSKACPCDECGSKIAKLKEFEKDIMAKRDLIQHHIVQVENKVFLCLKLSSAAEWPKRMLDIFHKKLKAVSQKSGVPLTIKKSSSADNLGVMGLTIHQMLVKSGLLVKQVEEVHDDDDDDDDDVFVEIKSGRFYCKHTKAQDTANFLLQQIENNEIYYDTEKRNVQADGKILHPSVSKIQREKQVELLKKFPFEILKLEAEELIEEVGSLKTHRENYVGASDCISHISLAMITERNRFWKRSPKGNEHILNGVNQTLDSLLTKVTLFEDDWNKYATFFTPRDRAKPKRQR